MFYIYFNARVWVLELISTTEFRCIYIFLNARVQMSLNFFQRVQICFLFLSVPEFRCLQISFKPEIRCLYISFNATVQISLNFF